MRILFVCTGNTCRSPMAEAIFNHMAKQAGIAAEARSVGVAALTGTPMSDKSQKALKDRGISAEHRSKLLSEEDIAWADLILTMTIGHKRAVIEQYPDAIDKVYALKEYTRDDLELRRHLEERESLIAGMQLSIAANQPLDERDKERLLELEQLLPNFDIADPFGGDQRVYDHCAVEIEEELKRLIDKLQGSANGLYEGSAGEKLSGIESEHLPESGDMHLPGTEDEHRLGTEDEYQSGAENNHLPDAGDGNEQNMESGEGGEKQDPS
ncbi:low molecular weight protein arginine phosphatase [Insulibacter thermoxylanivorax]|nr:low molecular weight protein arginine phosphatase [Insulibacter thermoxylanivorax]